MENSSLGQRIKYSLDYVEKLIDSHDLDIQDLVELNLKLQEAKNDPYFTHDKLSIVYLIGSVQSWIVMVHNARNPDFKPETIGEFFLVVMDNELK
jgi:hypothetical protein